MKRWSERPHNRNSGLTTLLQRSEHKSAPRNFNNQHQCISIKRSFTFGLPAALDGVFEGNGGRLAGRPIQRSFERHTQQSGKPSRRCSNLW